MMKKKTEKQLREWENNEKQMKINAVQKQIGITKTIRKEKKEKKNEILVNNSELRNNKSTSRKKKRNTQILKQNHITYKEN